LLELKVENDAGLDTFAGLITPDFWTDWLTRSIFFFFTLVAGPRRSLRLELSETRVYELQIRDINSSNQLCKVKKWPEVDKWPFLGHTIKDA